MRILDIDNDKAVYYTVLLLTRSEAQELRDSLDGLLESQNSCIHHHVIDDGLKHEITVVLYDDGHVETFNDRCIKLIQQDI